MFIEWVERVYEFSIIMRPCIETYAYITFFSVLAMITKITETNSVYYMSQTIMITFFALITCLYPFLPLILHYKYDLFNDKWLS
jgi:hypothetical protein